MRLISIVLWLVLNPLVYFLNNSGLVFVYVFSLMFFSVCNRMKNSACDYLFFFFLVAMPLAINSSMIRSVHDSKIVFFLNFSIFISVLFQIYYYKKSIRGTR